MAGGGKSITVGYQYYLGIHMALCHGPVDKITRIKVDDRDAWVGSTPGGTINVYAPDLFGGEGREGGISGAVDIEMGRDDQLENEYLQSKLQDTPAFRGVTCAVLNQVYMGNNPYMKPWSFTAQRIHVRQNGLAQWYDSKAEINTRTELGQLRVYFALDASMSLTEAEFVAYKEAMIVALNRMEEESVGITYPIYINAFNSGPNFILDYSTPEGFIRLRYWIENDMSQAFGTLPYAAFGPITFEPYYFPIDRASSNVIFFVCDGEIDDPDPGVPEMWEFIDTLNDPYSTASGTAVRIKSIMVHSYNGGAIPSSTKKAKMELYDNTGEDLPIFGILGDTDKAEFAQIIIDNLSIDTNTEADMNPAHIIRECLTDPTWGMGYADSDIDDGAFMYAADILFTEELGIAILWQEEASIIDFVSEILRHIDAVLYVSRETGKFILKLIRDDYSLSNLITLDESNIVAVKNASRPAIGDLVASVTVNYWNYETGNTASVTKHNQALFQVQTGGGGATTVQYPGLTNISTASRACLRDLFALSTALLSCTIDVGRVAEQLNCGDVFILNWPDLGINGLLMRVQQMSLGSIEKNTITIDAIEDVFSLPSVDTVSGQDNLWTDPLDADVLQPYPRLVTEAPYYDIARTVGDAVIQGIENIEPNYGYLLAASGKQSTEMNARLMVDSGDGYVFSGSLDFCPVAFYVPPVGVTDTQIYITGGVDLDDIIFGNAAIIEDEIIRVDSIGADSIGTFITVGRGCLDTTPVSHTDAGAVIFYASSWTSDDVQYVTSDAVNVKLLSVLGPNVLAEEDADVDTVTMAYRGVRPYPPGDLIVDGLSYDPSSIYYDTSALTWSHRDRLQQTGTYLYDYTAADIGPEAGTQYIVRADAILLDTTISADFVEENVGGAASYSHGITGGTPPGDADYIRWKVYSVRDGYESWQPAMAIVRYAPADSNLSLWTPAYTTTDLWLDCSNAGNTITSGNMQTLVDLSGKGYNATQSTSGERPTWNAADLNGLDTITFDGTNDHLEYNSACNIMRNMPSAMTFIVFKHGTASPAGTGIYFGVRNNVDAGRRIRTYINAAGAQGLSSQRLDAGTETGLLISASGTDTSWGVRSYITDWTNRTISIYTDGVLEGTLNPIADAAGSTSNTNASRYRIGSSTLNTPDSFWSGSIAEIVIIPSDVTLNTRQKLEGYLAHKWGLQGNLPLDHQYKGQPPYLVSST